MIEGVLAEETHQLRLDVLQDEVRRFDGEALHGDVDGLCLRDGDLLLGELEVGVLADADFALAVHQVQDLVATGQRVLGMVHGVVGRR